jgi:hypothetical protein
MKKLIFCLVLVTGVCRAEEWMETINEAGGKILFLSYACPEGTTGRKVIATMRDGGTIHGCWYFFADMVHVVWVGQNGKTSAYDPKTLSYRKSD